MINKDEILFIVDENNNPIEPMARHEAHTVGAWHRCVEIWVVNSKGQVMCNQRSMFKDNSPGAWESYFGGHVLASTETLATAIRELEEECGLVAKPSDLEFFEICKQSTREGKNNEFLYVYIYKWDGDISELKLEKEEVDDVRWLSIADLEKNISEKSDEKWLKPMYIHRMLAKLQTNKLQ